MAHILAVDDEPGVRRFVSRVLREAGHEVSLAADAESAILLLLGRRPDVFLLDINLPGMHGLDLARKLRRQRATQAVPVVILSVRSDPRDKVAAYASGAMTYLQKPFKKADLLDAIRTALHHAPRRPRRR